MNAATVVATQLSSYRNGELYKEWETLGGILPDGCPQDYEREGLAEPQRFLDGLSAEKLSATDEDVHLFFGRRCLRTLITPQIDDLMKVVRGRGNRFGGRAPAPEDGEDALGEMFVTVFENPFPYLHTFARVEKVRRKFVFANEVKNALGRIDRTVRRQRANSLDDSPEPSDLRAGPNDPSEIDPKKLMALLRRGLSFKEFLAYVFRYELGLAPERISELMGWSRADVFRTLRQMRMSVAEILAKTDMVDLAS